MSNASETYTVIVRGENFLLSRAQIEYDSPNYFTACFLGEFTESQTRTLTLSRDPELFKIVLDHLSGYEVLPLHESIIPERMSPEAALRNLRADAQFYLLDDLTDQINSKIQGSGSAKSSLLSPYVIISARSEKDEEGEFTRNVWSPAVSLSEDVVSQIRLQHGIQDPALMSLFQSFEPDIKKALRRAKAPLAYVVEAAWATYAKAMTMNFVLKLIE